MAGSLNLANLDAAPSSATFGQDASFRLEQPIGSMSISPSGRDVVLASKEGLHIIDLDSPYSPPRHLPHRTPWEVADVQWSPFAARDYWIASTSNQKALVWNVGSHGDRDAIEFVLHGHSRAITDINFSAHHPEVLATCAVDSFVHGWDLRSPSRPAFSFSDWFAGASQVKFSRQDENVVASSHDRSLHIWDKRKGAYPTKTIEAHETKICGIDWNRFETSKIVTCSLDKTIKFWNIDNCSEGPERVIETGFPVWRARHTPFGWGLLAMPQRGTNELYLYDRRPIDGTLPTGHVRAVTTFSGHKGSVKEFLWRSCGNVTDIDYRDFQLVSWGTDRELHLHHVPEEVFHDVGYERGVTRAQRLNYTRRGARYRTFRDGAIEPYSPSETPFRTESFPSQGQFLSLRNRQSTNIGMSKVPVAQFRGWLQGNKKERRTGMHGKGTVRQDINPIKWMKNVKIASWDPDSLADEITQVGEKFQKVEFDSIDIGQRKAVMSLQGPWGENGSMIYTRVEFRFPKTYPRSTNAIVMLQKSNSINPTMHRTLSTEIHTIAETYASRQRGCIEAVVRYLLHEQSMEEIVSWLLGETISDSKLLDSTELPDELSSDSDDEHLSVSIDASNSAANIRVPIAKGCGALWANDGRLVCFFPKEPKEPESVLAKQDISGFDNTQSSRLFDAFGRLQTSSPARKQTYGASNIADDQDSNSSDAGSMFSSSSSSSSSSSGAEDILRDRYLPYGNGISLAVHRQRSRSGDRSNKSTTMDGTKPDVAAQLNVISIHHDMGDLIPAKRGMAEHYSIMGGSRDICEHNAAVAAKSGMREAASVWNLAGLILDRKVPLEAIKAVHDGFTDIVYIAQRSSLTLKHIAGVPKTNDSMPRKSSKGGGLEGCIRWGNSPLASTYLITAMFQYFERKSDVQMLATLSCVILQSEHAALLRYFQDRRISTSQIPLAGRLYYPSAEVALSLRTHGGAEGAGAVSDPSLLRDGAAFELHVTVPDHAHARLRRQTLDAGSGTRAYDVNHPGHRDMLSTADSRFNQKIRTSAQAISASSSPEDLRGEHRMMPGSNFPASRASLSAVAQNYSRSPPSENSTAASSLKKASPSTSLSTSSTWAGTLFGRDTGTRGYARQPGNPADVLNEDDRRLNLRPSVSSAHIPEHRRDSRKATDFSRGSIRSSTTANGDSPRKQKATRKRLVRTTLHNQDCFDLDSYSHRPLIDPSCAHKHAAYRMAYAELLAVWKMWPQRSEILQLDAILNSSTSDNKQQGNKTFNPDLISGLEVVRCCPECGKELVQLPSRVDENRWHCTSNGCLLSVAKLSQSQTCSICQRIIRGLLVPCLQCGHITCYECAQDWFGASNIVEGRSVSHTRSTSDRSTATSHNESAQQRQNQCPTGCGCTCTMLKEVSVPWPSNSTDETFGRNNTATSTGTPSASTNASTNMNGASVTFRNTSTTSNTITSNTPQFGGRHNLKRQDPGPDTALGAMMALSSRSRAPSTTASTTTIPTPDEGSHTGSGGSTGTSVGAFSLEDELMPWASGRFTSLGRGIGGGLSRGLSNRSSDATIRKA